MPRLVRAAALPLAAVVLIAAVLGLQLSHGGGEFEPLRPADPCSVHTATSQADGIDGLTERLVVLGVDHAACRLGLSRETLLLDLAQPDVRTDTQVEALHGGLLAAVADLDEAGTLPPSSDLIGEALDDSDLNSVAKTAIGLLPDSAIDAALKTDDVLTRTIDDLDLDTLLGNLDDPDQLDAQIQKAVTSAVEASLLNRLQDVF